MHYAVCLGMINASAATYGELTYTVSGGKVTITGCNSSASGTLIIPETIDGYPVTTIGQYAFAKKLKDYALSGGKLYNNLGVRHRDLIGTESMI